MLLLQPLQHLEGSHRRLHCPWQGQRRLPWHLPQETRFPLSPPPPQLLPPLPGHGVLPQPCEGGPRVALWHRRRGLARQRGPAGGRGARAGSGRPWQAWLDEAWAAGHPPAPPRMQRLQRAARPCRRGRTPRRTRPSARGQRLQKTRAPGPRARGCGRAETPTCLTSGDSGLLGSQRSPERNRAGTLLLALRRCPLASHARCPHHQSPHYQTRRSLRGAPAAGALRPPKLAGPQRQQ